MNERYPTSPVPPDYRAPRAEALLRQAIELIEQARPMPLSGSSMINKDEVLAVLMEAAETLPEELRAARWLLKERDDFLSRVQGEGDAIINTARAQAEQMVQRTEVVKASEERAQRVVASAEDQARRLKLETEDWCDQKLGAMEVLLQRTLGTVASGRANLQGVAPDPSPSSSGSLGPGELEAQAKLADDDPVGPEF